MNVHELKCQVVNVAWRMHMHKVDWPCGLLITGCGARTGLAHSYSLRTYPSD